MTSRAEWIDREVEKNSRAIAELERRNRQLLRERSSPDADAELTAELRRVHDSVVEGEAEAADRTAVLRRALDKGWTKYRLARVLNVSRPTIYHYLEKRN